MSVTHAAHRYLKFTDDTPYRRYVEVDKKAPENQTASTNAATTTTHGSYGALVLHPKWKSRRKEILVRDNHRCIHCRSSRNLQVHHRQYHFVASHKQFKLPWDYPDNLLITLCERCHSRGHNKYKVPTITI